MDDLLIWLLDTVQSIDPVARTLIAGLAVMLETSILIGLVVPGDTIGDHRLDGGRHSTGGRRDGASRS